MNSDFFMTEEEAREIGCGFELFSPAYFMWIGVLVIIGFGIIFAYCRTPKEKRRGFELVIGLSILGINLARAVWLFATGTYSIGYLPLHLCGMSIYLEAFNSVYPNRVTREIMFAASMPGAFMALITPNWNIFPAFSFYSICCYLLHALLVIYPLMLLIGGDFRPSLKRLPIAVAFLASVSVPVFFFNQKFETNFMFLRYAPSDTPLKWFEKLWGNPGYLLGFPIIAAVLWALLYVPFAVADAKKT